MLVRVAQEKLGENYSEDNPYRILVDKYEALLKNQQKQNNAFVNAMIPPADCSKDNRTQGVSLHEELQMSGQFSSFNGNASDSDDDGDAVNEAQANCGPGQGQAGAVCKYSETETTSSSGFSDETSNKGTQTENFFAGSFLCTISDGDDCRFSIYDDASPIESRFRKTPEYRQLFREIFAVLKRAAEAKDEGERLPLLQDERNDEGAEDYDDYCDDDDDSLMSSAVAAATTIAGTPRVPPATPACENNPLVSVIEQAAAAAASAVAPEQQQQEPQHLEQEQQQKQQQQDAPRAGETAPSERHKDQQPIVVKQQPPKQVRRQRDIIEELASTVKHKKHTRHHRKSAASSSRQQSQDISHLMEFKWADQVTRRPRTAGSGDRSHRATWCVPADADVAGAVAAATAEPPPGQYASTASQEVAKLKLLEKSYAEVLRLRKPPNRPQSQYFNSRK